MFENENLINNREWLKLFVEFIYVYGMTNKEALNEFLKVDINNVKRGYKDIKNCHNSLKRELREFKSEYRVIRDINRVKTENKENKQTFNERASFICNTVINNKRNVLSPFLSENAVNHFINNKNDYHVVKLNSKSLELLNLKFASFKNEYEYEYNGVNKVLLKNVNIKFKGSKYSCLLLGVLLMDTFNTFLIFRDYNVFFKLYIYDTLSNSKKALRDEFIELTEEEEHVLQCLNSNNRVFYSTEERIQFFKSQIDIYTDKLTEAQIRFKNTEKRLNNNIKHCKVLERKNKSTEAFLERQKEYKKFLGIFESQINVFYDKVYYYNKRLKEEEDQEDAFKSSNNYSDTVFEDYECFKYSFKELKHLSLLD